MSCVTRVSVARGGWSSAVYAVPARIRGEKNEIKKPYAGPSRPSDEGDDLVSKDTELHRVTSS